MRQGARSAAGLVAACAVLAGCSDDTGSTATTLPPLTVSPSDSATTDPSPTAPDTASATDPTPTTSARLPDEHVATAEIFLAGYLEALNNVKASGDFSSFDALYLPGCVGCLEMRNEMVGWLDDGQTVEGADWVVLQQSSSQLADGSRATVIYLMFRTQGTTFNANGEAIGDLPATGVQLGTAGLAAADPWKMEGIAFDASPM